VFSLYNGNVILKYGKMEKEYSIIYMGTPEFAVEPLKKLLENSYKVAAVVTVADKPAGRGLKLQASPVKQFATEHNIPVLQPDKLKDPVFIEEIKSYNADLFIVVAFRKLPDVIWKLPPMGCFNLHGSLLPQYRGAAPINHAIINGETTTGVTTFFLNEEIDTGKVIMQKEIPIGPDETAGELHDRMMVTGAEVVIETVKMIFTNEVKAVEQSDMTPSLKDIPLKSAPKIFRNDCRINWDNKASDVHNFIRGLSPYPGSYSMVTAENGESELKVLKSTLTTIPSVGQPGSLQIEKSKLLVACNDFYIRIDSVQPAGKRPMPVADFLNGQRGNLTSFR